MKKSKLFLSILLSGSVLVGCSSSQDTEKISKMEEKISGLEKEVENLKKIIDTDPNREVGTGTSTKARELENENTKTLSGEIVVGEDLEPGKYNITVPEGVSDVALYYADSKEDMDNGDWGMEWLFSAKGTDYERDDDTLQGYKLSEGMVLNTSGDNINFTKVE